MSDLRFYRDGMAETYRLQCVGCGADLFNWPFALEKRHIVEVADLTLSHICGGE